MRNEGKYIVALIFIAIVTHLAWFDVSSTLFFGDWRFLSQDVVGEMLNMGRAMWISVLEMGNANIQVSNFPYRYAWGILGSESLAVKVTLLWPIVFFSFFAPYYFVKKIVPNVQSAAAPFLTALFFAFNTYLVVRTTKHLPIAVVIVLAPIFLVFVKNVAKHPTYKNILTTLLLATLLIMYEIRIALLVFAASLPLFIFYLDIHKYTIKKILVTGALFTMLQLFWLLPTSFLGSEISGVADRGLFGTHLFDLAHSMTMTDYKWTGSMPAIEFEKQPVRPTAFVIVIFAFLPFVLRGFYKTGYMKLYLVFALLSLVGIFLGKQSAEPFTGAYLWLYDNVPGFNLYRTGAKFYLLTILGYLGMFALSINFLLHKFRHNKTASSALCGFLAVIFLIPAIPMATKSIDTMYVHREMPDNYVVLNEYLKSDEPTRSLWVPSSSNWGHFSISNPKASMVHQLNTSWSDYVPESADYQKEDLFGLFNEKYMENLVQTASVKYIVLPDFRDDFSDSIYKNKEEYDLVASSIVAIDWLTEINDDGLGDIRLFRNNLYMLHIDTLDSLFTLNVTNSTEEKHNFITKHYLGTDSYFGITTGDLPAELPATNIDLLFENVLNEDIDIERSVVNYALGYFGAGADLYVNLNKRDVEVAQVDGRYVFSSVYNNNLNYDAPATSTELYAAGIDGEVYIKNGRVVQKIQDVQTLDADFVTEVYTANGNDLVSNGGFEGGLWQDEVGDCHNYDDKPVLEMKRVMDESGSYVLQLEATRHIACTKTETSQIFGDQEYLIEFNYRGVKAERAGYSLKFAGSAEEGETGYTEKLSLNNDEWKHYARVVRAPVGTESIDFFLYAYQSDKKKNNIVQYDNVNIKAVELSKSIAPQGEDEFVKINLPEVSDSYYFEYLDQGHDFSNRIVNGSFGDGLWSDEVANCNNKDNNPIIAMSAVVGLDSAALQLESTRHIACTSQSGISINPLTQYLLGFKFQSDNAERVGYNLGFNSEPRINLSLKPYVLSDDWVTYNKTINTPMDSSEVNLHVYSYPTDDATNIITRYDNFELIELPDIANRYYLVQDYQEQFEKPKSVQFELVNPTKKTVSVKGATTPFYLAMSESYHTKWQAQFNNENINGLFDKWVPFVTPDKIPDEHHFELNGFLNGWYVDTDEYCRNNNLCTENQDGSYDMELVLEFFPQRWFYLGLLISGTTFFSLIGYLIYDSVRRRREKKEKLILNLKR